MQQRLNPIDSALRFNSRKLGSLVARTLGAAVLSAVALSTTSAEAAPMQVSGNQLLDSCGQVFVVRGVELILAETAETTPAALDVAGIFIFPPSGPTGWPGARVQRR
jgi:hypothetical protein